MCILLQLCKSNHIKNTRRIKSKVVINILGNRKKLSDFFQNIDLMKTVLASTGIPPTLRLCTGNQYCLLDSLASGCPAANLNHPPKRTDRADQESLG